MPAGPAAIRVTDIANSRWRAHVLESGPPDAAALVLVHGNVSSAQFFAETMSGLGARWHCVAVDLRGFGQSEARPVDARRGRPRLRRRPAGAAG
ncbi:MAG: alpha/beta fold hydrolase [Streptosporangiaceae bacterium]